MLQGPLLRAAVNRRMTIDGEFTMDLRRTHIRLKGFKATDLEGKTRSVLKEGDIVTLVSLATVSTAEPILTLRANPSLYSSGSVRMIPMITPTDGTVQIVISYQANDKVDLKKLDYLVEVYVNG